MFNFLDISNVKVFPPTAVLPVTLIMPFSRMATSVAVELISTMTVGKSPSSMSRRSLAIEFIPGSTRLTVRFTRLQASTILSISNLGAAETNTLIFSSDSLIIS